MTGRFISPQVPSFVGDLIRYYPIHGNYYRGIHTQIRPLGDRRLDTAYPARTDKMCGALNLLEPA